MKFIVHHVAFTVNNLEKSQQFYEKLGFKHFFEYSDEKLKICHLKNDSSFIVELFEHKGQLHRVNPEPSTIEKHLLKHGVNHFALAVSNLEEAYAFIQLQGIRVNTEIKIGRTNIKYFFINDPDGNFVEIVEDRR